jgi:hypothetical protein
MFLRTVLYITACGVTATAETITYTETVTTSGNLDGTPFTDALVTLSLTGDTANIANTGGGNYDLKGTLTINVSGLASDALLDQAEVQVYQSVPYAGFFADSAIVLFTHNSSFASYALATPIGPITGASTGYTGGAYNTVSGGAFYLAGPFNDDHPSTFTASVHGTVPEPGTFLLAFGGLGIAWASRAKSAWLNRK